MPVIVRIECDTCDTCFNTGWGSRSYVALADGSRHICSHPGEEEQARYFLERELTDFQRRFRKRKALKKLVSQRLRNESAIVCRVCGETSWVDEEGDELKSEGCGHADVVRAISLVGEACPKCAVGKIRSITTDFIC